MMGTLTLRQLILALLAVVYGKSQKEIGAGSGMDSKEVSQYLKRRRTSELKDEIFDRLLAPLKCPPAAVPIVTTCVEALEALEHDDLTPEERVVVEEEVLQGARLQRKALTEAVHRSRAVPTEGYPQAHDLEPVRLRAEELFARLKNYPADVRSAVIEVAEEFQAWALCERCCDASARENSRKLEDAAAWARLAQEIAMRVRGPEEWRVRLQGYAAAHAANVLRVVGELKAAEAELTEAKRLWESGSDPAGILDFGRMLSVEAALRRDQRRFDEALALLEEAVAVGRQPELALIQKGFTLEVLGDYEGAVEALLQAAPRLDRRADPLFWYNQRFNLAVNFLHLHRCGEAAELMPAVRDLATDLGDEIFLIRVTWLDGRIAAGFGQRFEARRLLGEARREFGRRRMSYDAALALLEEAVLLLEEGRTAEVKALAGELTKLFEDKGVHREALAALWLFREAAEREEATAELARRVLRYLFRARHDQGLRFGS